MRQLQHMTDEEIRRADQLEDMRRFWNVAGTLVMGAMFLLCVALALKAGIFSQ